MFFGTDAVSAGLADKLGTFDDACADLRSRLTQQRPALSPIRNLKRKDKTMTDPVNTTAETQSVDASLVDPAPDVEAITAQAKAEAQKEALAYVSEVTQLCQIAGMPDKAANFIAKATPAAEVRNALLTAKAVADEATAIASQIPTANSTTAAENKIDAAAIYASRNTQKED